MDKKYLGWALALLFVGAAHAQTAGVVNLSVTPTSGTSSVTPKLTWSTSPAATSCTATGGWSGTKSASGTQTLAAVRANASYTLTCTWGTGSATVRWTPPTTNTDGSTLTDMARYRVLYGTSSSSLTRSTTVSNPSASSVTIASLAPATWYFVVKAVNSLGVESSNSNVASKRITGATAAKTVNVTVRAASGSTLTTKATNVWDLYKRSDGAWLRRAVVGTIPLGKPCNPAIKVSSKHYAVNKSDVTKLYLTPQSTVLVVNCVGD
jgi:hypothetical protein